MKLKNSEKSKKEYPSFNSYRGLALGFGAVALLACSSQKKETKPENNPGNKDNITVKNSEKSKTDPKLPETVKNNGISIDSDGDGIADNLDNCIMQPEDKDGFEDKDGCPDFDNDKDGIVDKKDKCPNKPETKNGYQDYDGCPDRRRYHRTAGIMGRKVKAPNTDLAT
jgi:Thrombospondin type 3 repeat